MELSYWFKGFEKGLARLSAEQRGELLAECSKSCVRQGTFSIYQELYNQAHGDLDRFFAQADSLPGVGCEIVESGAVYHLYFKHCTCELCQKGMCLPRCFANAPDRVFSTSCRSCGQKSISG